MYKYLSNIFSSEPSNSEETLYINYIRLMRGENLSEQEKQHLRGFEFDEVTCKRLLLSSRPLDNAVYNKTITIYLHTDGDYGHISAKLPVLQKDLSIKVVNGIGLDPKHGESILKIITGAQGDVFAQSRSKESGRLLSVDIPVTEETYNLLAKKLAAYIESPPRYQVLGINHDNCVLFMHKLLIESGVVDGLKNKFDYNKFMEMEFGYIKIYAKFFFDEFKSELQQAHIASAFDLDEYKTELFFRDRVNKEFQNKAIESKHNQLVSDIQRIRNLVRNETGSTPESSGLNLPVMSTLPPMVPLDNWWESTPDNPLAIRGDWRVPNLSSNPDDNAEQTFGINTTDTTINTPSLLAPRTADFDSVTLSDILRACPYRNPNRFQAPDWFKDLKFKAHFQDANNWVIGVSSALSWKTMGISLVVMAAWSTWLHFHNKSAKKKFKRNKKRAEAQCNVVYSEVKSSSDATEEAVNSVKAYLDETNPMQRKTLRLAANAKVASAKSINQSAWEVNDNRLHGEHRAMPSGSTHLHQPRSDTKSYINEVKEVFEENNTTLINCEVALNETLPYDELNEQISKHSDSEVNKKAQAYLQGQIDENEFRETINKFTAEKQKIRDKASTLLAINQNQPEATSYLTAIVKQYDGEINDLPNFFQNNKDARNYNDKAEQFNRDYQNFVDTNKKKLNQLAENYQAGQLSEVDFAKNVAEQLTEGQRLLETAKELDRNEHFQTDSEPETTQREHATQSLISEDGITEAVTKENHTSDNNMTKLQRYLSDDIHTIQDFVENNIISRELSTVESVLNNKTQTKEDTENILSAFTKVDERWERLIDKKAGLKWMQHKGVLAYQAGQYNIAKSSAKTVISEDPKNFNALQLWISASLECKTPYSEILNTIGEYQSNFFTHRERGILLYFEGMLKKDKQSLNDAFDELEQAPDGTEKVSYLQSCMKYIENPNQSQRSVAMNIAHPDATRNLLEIDKWLKVLKAQLAAREIIRQSETLETDADQKKAIHKALEQDKKFLEETTDLLRGRLHHINSDAAQRWLYRSCYFHLGFDLCCDLFGESLAKRLGAEDAKAEVAGIRRIVDSACILLEYEFGNWVETSGKITFNDIANELGDLTAGEITDIKSVLNEVGQNDINPLKQFFSKYTGTMLTARLVIAILNYRLMKSHQHYQKESKAHNLSFEKWLELHWSRVLLSKLSNYVSKAVDISMVMDSFLSVYLKRSSPKTTYSELSLSIVRTFIQIPYLTELLLGNKDKHEVVTTNWARLFLGSFIQNMSANPLQQFLGYHGETAIRVIQNVLYRCSFYNAADRTGFITRRGIQLLIAANTCHALGKTIYYLPSCMVDHRIHNLQVAFDNLTKQVLENKNVHDADFLFGKIKDEAKSICDTIPGRQKVYIQSMFSQQRLKKKVELKKMQRDGNGFFSAVSCYTSETPEELRVLAADYLEINRTFFMHFITLSLESMPTDTKLLREFIEYFFSNYIFNIRKSGTLADELVIRALTIALKRPIIICYNDFDLDLKKQGMHSVGTIPQGDPIFVHYDQTTEEYNGMLLLDEDYFKVQHNNNLKRLGFFEHQNTLRDEQSSISNAAALM